MSDYQVLCVCVAAVIIVLIISVSIVIFGRYDFMNYKLITNEEYVCIQTRLDKIEGCVKALLKKKSEL